jgi:ferrous iron transport protein B
MNCGGKMPVYLLLVGTFFAAWKGLVMVSLMFISWGIALVCAKILSRTLVPGKASPMLIELPAYQLPRFPDVLRTASLQSWWFLKRAGTIILAVNVLLWCLMYFPRPQPKMEYGTVTEQWKPGTEHSAVTGSVGKNRQLENSYAGRIGRLLEPISRFAGFDWRDNVALTGGFVAKEVIVSSLGTLYSLDDTTSEISQSPGWNGIKAFAMIVFVMVYAPCTATCVVIYQETRKLRWVVTAIAFNTTVAYLLAVLVYQVGGIFS